MEETKAGENSLGIEKRLKMIAQAVEGMGKIEWLRMMLEDIEKTHLTTRKFAERLGITEKEMLERAEKIAEETGITVNNALNVVVEARYEEIAKEQGITIIDALGGMLGDMRDGRN